MVTASKNHLANFFSLPPPSTISFRLAPDKSLLRCLIARCKMLLRSHSLSLSITRMWMEPIMCTECPRGNVYNNVGTNHFSSSSVFSLQWPLVQCWVLRHDHTGTYGGITLWSALLNIAGNSSKSQGICLDFPPHTGILTNSDKIAKETIAGQQWNHRIKRKLIYFQSNKFIRLQ